MEERARAVDKPRAMDPPPNRKARRRADKRRLEKGSRWVHCDLCADAFYRLPKAYRLVSTKTALCAKCACREDGKSFIDGGVLALRSGVAVGWRRREALRQGARTASNDGGHSGDD